MKKKLLLGFVLSCFVNTGFTMEIKHGKLLNYKEWTTGNVEVTFKDHSITEKNDVLDLNLSNTPSLPSPIPNELNAYNLIDAKNKVIPSNAIVGMETIVMGESNVQIYNNTSGTQIYSVLTQVCAEFSPRSYYCGLSKAKISLDSYGSALIGKIPSVKLTYQEPGTYKALIYTLVMKDPDNTPTIVQTISQDKIKVKQE